MRKTLTISSSQLYRACFLWYTQQLLELGDRIGYVNTGLKESEIHRCLGKITPSISHTLGDRKCSICQVNSRLRQWLLETSDSFTLLFLIVWWWQDEYESEDEVGKLNCGHSFHVHCVKQWLSRKNACPVCKKTAYVKPWESCVYLVWFLIAQDIPFKPSCCIDLNHLILNSYLFVFAFSNYNYMSFDFLLLGLYLCDWNHYFYNTCTNKSLQSMYYVALVDLKQVESSKLAYSRHARN